MSRQNLRLFIFSGFCIAAAVGSVRAANEFNTNGTGDLADSANWSQGAPPAPGTSGFISGSGNTQTFLSENLTTGTWNLVRPAGELAIDLQGNTLTSSRLLLKPTPSSVVEPLTAGLVVRDGTVHSNLELETGGLGNQQPKTINATVSNVDWTGEEWFLKGTASIPGPGNEQTEKINVTIDQGSKVTLDRLLAGRNSRVHVDGSSTKLDFKQAIVVGSTPQQSSGFTNIFSGVSTLSATNGATVRTLETNAPIELSRLQSALIDGVSFSASLRQLDLDGVDTRLIAADANLAIIELDISNGAAIETNRPLYVLAEVEITNATASHDLISPLNASIVNLLVPGTGLEHKVSLKNATLNGDVTDFRFIDLNNAVLNGNVKGMEAIRGEGIINGDLGPQMFDVPRFVRFFPSGLIDINGEVFGSVSVEALLSGPPDAHTPRVEVDSVKLPVDPVLGQIPEPFRFDVDFDDLFRASVGNRFELFSCAAPIFDQDPFENINPPLRDVYEQIISRMSFHNAPPGYNFDIFIEPHAIGFTVTAVPEASSFAMLLAAAFFGTTIFTYRSISPRKRHG